MKRSPLARGTSVLARRTPVAAKSAKAKAEAPEMAAWHDAVMARDRGLCQLPISYLRADEHTMEWIRSGPGIGRCQGRPEAHHVKPRSRCSILERTDPANGKMLCSFHHQWVDLNPAEAKVLGLLR